MHVYLNQQTREQCAWILLTTRTEIAVSDGVEEENVVVMLIQ